MQCSAVQYSGTLLSLGQGAGASCQKEGLRFEFFCFYIVAGTYVSSGQLLFCLIYKTAVEYYR
jgi:hypothetical protein